MGGLQKLLLLVFWSFFYYTVAVNGQSINITSLPESLFEANDGGNIIVERSVIQLYCSVEPATAIVSWRKDDAPVIIDIPHLRVRTSSNGTHTTSVLTLDNFRSGDNGKYQCQAMSGGVTESGQTVDLTAVVPASGVLILRQQPSDNSITRLGSTLVTSLRDNQTSVSLGATIDPSSTPDSQKILRCVAGHLSDDIVSYNPSTVVWIKDGETLESGGDLTISTSIAVNGQVSSNLQIVNFQESNAGVYQCIFTDDSRSRGEIITTIPVRLDTGETLIATRVSPQTIVLSPPEKLVIEVQTSGRYSFIAWYRNTDLFASLPTSPFFVRVPNFFPLSSELIEYFDIFVREPTTVSDLGVFTVQLQPINVTTQDYTQAEVLFYVTLPVNASTTISSGPTVTVLEGGSVDISCTSTGVPTPSITWSFSGVAPSFDQTDTVVDYNATFVPFVRYNVTLQLGNFTSVLHIVNASYPEHDGEYICTGANTRKNMLVSRSESSTTVRVQVPPTILPLDDDQEIIVNETESAVLSFRIDRVAPPIQLEDIQWIYSFQFPSNPFSTEGGVAYDNITSVTNRTGLSRLSFSQDLLSLTIDNIILAERIEASDEFVTDQGRYFLVVAHPTGTWYSYIDLIVKGPPLIFSKPIDRTVIDDSSLANVVLRCSAVAFPQHSVSWTFTNTEGGQTNTISTSAAADSSKYRIISDPESDRFGELTVLDVRYEDRGTYTCTAQNILGSETKAASLVVLRLPPTPTMLTVTSVTSRSVVVSWQIDTSTIPITGYMVRVVTSITSQAVFNVSAEDLSLTLRDLQPATEYQFFISSVNTAGNGEQVSTRFTTIIGVQLFQLRLLLSGVGRTCTEWVAQDQAGAEQAIDEVANSIVTNVEERCQCGFTRSNITSDGFRCFPGSTDAVTYRGEIHETETANVFDLIRHIEDWTTGEILIRVQRLFIKVDPSCRVAIDSFTEEECLPRESIDPGDDGGGSSAAAIAGGVVVAVIVLVLIGLIVVVIAIILLTRKKSYKLPDTKTTFNYAQNGRSDTIKKTKEDEEPEYETVDMTVFPRDYEIPLPMNSCNEGHKSDPSRSSHKPPLTTGTSFELTQCLAYETTSLGDSSTQEDMKKASPSVTKSTQSPEVDKDIEAKVIKNPKPMQEEEYEYIAPLTMIPSEAEVIKNTQAMETEEEEYIEPSTVILSGSQEKPSDSNVTRNGDLEKDEEVKVTMDTEEEAVDDYVAMVSLTEEKTSPEGSGKDSKNEVATETIKQ